MRLERSSGLMVSAADWRIELEGEELELDWFSLIDASNFTDPGSDHIYLTPRLSIIRYPHLR